MNQASVARRRIRRPLVAGTYPVSEPQRRCSWVDSRSSTIASRRSTSGRWPFWRRTSESTPSRSAARSRAGTADEWSDLDLQVVGWSDSYDDLLADWPSWLDAISPTVFARTPIAPFVINAVTDEGLTLDIVVYKGKAFDFPSPSDYAVGMLSSVRFADLDDALEYAVAEMLRGLAGPFISLVARGEHLRHLTGVPHLIGLLTTVFLAELDAPRTGQALEPNVHARTARRGIGSSPGERNSRGRRRIRVGRGSIAGEPRPSTARRP